MSAPNRPWSSPRAAFDFRARSQRFHELTQPRPSRDRMNRAGGGEKATVPSWMKDCFRDRSPKSIWTKWVNLKKYTPESQLSHQMVPPPLSLFGLLLFFVVEHQCRLG